MKGILLALILLSGAAWGVTCPTNTIQAAANPTGWWCNTQAGISPPNGDWNNLLFVLDTGLWYLYANDTSPADATLMEDAIWAYPKQTASSGTTVWSEITRLGDSSNSDLSDQRECLTTTILSTDTAPLNMNVAFGAACTQPQDTRHLPAAGLILMDEELFSYDTCLGCSTGSASAALHITARALKTSIGYTGAVTHTATGVSTTTSWGHSAGRGNNNAGGGYLTGYITGIDMPALRHPTGNMAYDSTRGMIWTGFGSQETYAYGDMWWMCVAVKAGGCTSAQVSGASAGWHFQPQIALNGITPVSDPGSSWVYDPVNDVIFKYGGTFTGGGTSGNVGAWIFPLSCPTTAYINGATCTPYKWYHIAQGSGRGVTVNVSFPRITYDSSVARMLVFGGKIGGISGTNSVSVQQYKVTTGEWCMSQLETNLVGPGGTNSTAAWCTALPAVSGPTPTPANGNLNFPGWTFDSTRNVASYYAGGGAIYEYASATNTWTSLTVTGGPSFVSTLQGSWQYDLADDLYVWEIEGEGSGTRTDVWQLPGTAISSPVVIPIPRTTRGATSH